MKHRRVLYPALAIVVLLGLFFLPLAGHARAAGLALQTNEATFQQSVNGYAGTQINYIRPDFPWDQQPALPLQIASSAVNRIKVVTRFDDIVGTGPGQIPPGAQIISAQLEMYCLQTIPPGGIPGPAQQTVGVYPLLQQFNQGDVTWAFRTAGTPWNTPGAEAASDTAPFDGTADRRATAEDQVLVNAIGWWQWDVTASLQQQVDAGKFYGWAVASYEDTEVFTRWSTEPILQVQYRYLEGQGFYQPVNMSGSLNSVKGGSTVPLKFNIYEGSQEITDPTLLNVAVTAVTCPSGESSVAVASDTSGNTGLRYDTTGGTFIYNWQTPNQPGACYRVSVTDTSGLQIPLQNGSGPLAAEFQLR